MHINQIKDWLQVAAYLVGIIAAIMSYWQYHQNSKREHARWLFELYQPFYETGTFKDIRLLLESSDTTFAEKGTDEQKLQKLDDYLNFFEFVAYLRKNGQLKDDEIKDMFDYPLRQMANDRSVFRYVSKPEYGFEGLCKLLADLRDVSDAKNH